MKEITTALLVIILFVVVNIAHLPVLVSATSVDKLFICDVEGYAGDVIDIPITLRSTSDSERAGYWSIFCKKVEGESDDKKMDITDWITITPPNYILKSGEVKSFTITISIPADVSPGLYGATSPDADMEGHSDERRTYIVFEDADTSATDAGASAVKSGMLIPVSVKVLEEESLFDAVNETAERNTILALVGTVIILISAFVLIVRRKKRQR